MKTIDKKIIKRNFSKYARQYDKHSLIQRNCAFRLISKIENANFKNILDIGCGTGIYTRFLRDRFRGAHIKAIDISHDMIEVAKEKFPDKKTEFIVGDAETMDFKEEFDLVTSNASLQWFTNLEKTLLKHKMLLKEKGVIAFSIFGPETFRELSEALKKLFGEDSFISSHSFVTNSEVTKILKSLLNNVTVEDARYNQKYESLAELLKNIKYSGIRGNGANRKTVWVPGIMKELEKIYLDKFKNIVARYQVFFCKGEK